LLGIGCSAAQHNVVQNSVPIQSSAMQRCGAEQYTHSLASKKAPLAPVTGLTVEGAQPTLKAAVEEVAVSLSSL